MQHGISSFWQRLIRNNESGSVLVEFALLAPAYMTLLMGVFQVGAWVQNYNAVRNLTADGARFAVVQYQRGNALTTVQMESYLRARGIGDTYHLNTDRLGTTVTQETSRIAGVTEMSIRISYAPPDWLAFVDGETLTIVYERPVFLLIP